LAGSAGRHCRTSHEAPGFEEGRGIAKAMKVFLSYVSEDRAVAAKVAENLRQAGHDVYPTPQWPQDIGAALSRAEAFVVMLSPAAVGSPFVNQEIRLALISEGLEDRVIPVVLKSSTQVPWILQTMRPIKAPTNAKALARKINERLKKVADGVER
jgi:hypothetical protein